MMYIRFDWLQTCFVWLHHLYWLPQSRYSMEYAQKVYNWCSWFGHVVFMEVKARVANFQWYGKTEKSQKLSTKQKTRKTVLLYCRPKQRNPQVMCMLLLTVLGAWCGWLYTNPSWFISILLIIWFAGCNTRFGNTWFCFLLWFYLEMCMI